MSPNYFKSLSLVLVAIQLLFSSSVQAEFFSVSAGVPLSHNLTGKDSNDVKYSSDGVSGVFFHIKFPLLVGVGLETYETTIKDTTTKLGTTMYDIFYQLPIPIINLTIGLGTGQTELNCTGCSSTYDKGNATQWYTSLGYPFIGIMDFHISYRSVSSKIKAKSGSYEFNSSGNVTGIGISIGF